MSDIQMGRLYVSHDSSGIDIYIYTICFYNNQIIGKMVKTIMFREQENVIVNFIPSEILANYVLVTDDL